jgi:hypothetical protein
LQGRVDVDAHELGTDGGVETSVRWAAPWHLPSTVTSDAGHAKHTLRGFVRATDCDRECLERGRTWSRLRSLPSKTFDQYHLTRWLGSSMMRKSNATASATLPPMQVSRAPEGQNWLTHPQARRRDCLTLSKSKEDFGPDGRIALVRFDRVNGVNALSPEAIRQLADAARSFEEDANTSVVILTGAV